MYSSYLLDLVHYMLESLKIRFFELVSGAGSYLQLLRPDS